MILGLALTLTATTISLHAQSAPAPSGNWNGATNGQYHVGVTLSVTSSGCSYSDPFITLTGARCAWEPTASNGGMLTLFYDANGFHNKLLVGIAWVTEDKIIARLGPGDDGAATLTRW